MPRPKRTKIASSTAPRVATTSRAADPAPRQQQVSKAQTSNAPEVLEKFSSDSDGIVVRSTSTRSRRRMPWMRTPEPVDEAELTMTGALPAERNAPVLSIKDRTPTSNLAKETRAARSSTRSTSRRKLPVTSIPAQTTAGSQDDSVEDEGSSGFSNLLSFTSLGSESPAHGTRPPSAIKVGATPAHETSILALTNFKRRPRQPSLLRMVHQTTDAEDNDLECLDDFDDFHPDAESTPLHERKNAHAEGSGDNSGLSLSSSASRGTKRKLSPIVQVPRSSPTYEPPSGDDVVNSRSPSPSLPEVIQSTEDVVEEQPEPEILSETMAPPRSSSPPVNEMEIRPDSPKKTWPRRRGRSAKKAEANNDSEGDETDRPTKSKAKTKTRGNRGMSTAQLKGLLPRRRTRMPQEHDEYDVQSSDEVIPVDSDEDELQMPPRRQLATSRKSAAPKITKKLARGAKKSMVNARSVQKNPRTYSRRTSSDKENENEESGEAEETTETSITANPSKLAAIAKKFQDVDAFEMDFESVDMGGSSSSPWR